MIKVEGAQCSNLWHSNKVRGVLRKGLSHAIMFGVNDRPMRRYRPRKKR